MLRLRTGCVFLPERPLLSTCRPRSSDVPPYWPLLTSNLSGCVNPLTLIPPSRNYRHEQAWHEGNGHSDLQAIRLGPSLTVSNSVGRLVLGAWQQIFHLEYDVRGREHPTVVTVIGDERHSTRK